jgi:DNA modification methylase
VTEQIEQRAVASLVPYARNARTHPEAQIAQIMASIREFGFVNPVLVTPAGDIIAGHGRVEAARRLGMETVPCRVISHFTEAQRRAYVLADNQLATKSGWDVSMLTIELDEIKTLGVDVEMLGFDAADLKELKAEAEAVSQRGEVYELGPHRLMCGDSTSVEDWQALMPGETGDAVMTDPPYGVNYVGKTKDALPVENDDPEGLPALLNGALGCVLERCKPGGAWYVAAPAGPPSLVFENWLYEKEILRQCIVWVKDSMVLGHSDYHYKHEPIYYGWKPGAPHRAPPDRTQVSVWEIPRPKRSAEHPTMKPVELYDRMINNSTAPGEVVLEPFGGSGTTLIACAKTGRVCRAMEISPRYCDVIRRRWTRWAKENNRPVGTGGLE